MGGDFESEIEKDDMNDQLPASLNPLSSKNTEGSEIHPASCAYWITASPHEWVWSQAEQESMARAVVQLDKERAELQKALCYYRSAIERVMPEYVPSRVRLRNTVRGDGHCSSTFVVRGDHECTSNKWGAISVVATNGKQLGLKPAEFDVIEWRANEI